MRLRWKFLILLVMFVVAFWPLFLYADYARGATVPLGEASRAPSYLRLLNPGRTTTVLHQCRHGGYWSDINVYRWNGAAYAEQRWNADQTVMSWGRASFNGITFSNRSNVPLLVAGWCER
jgi:hypothetical protein